MPISPAALPLDGPFHIVGRGRMGEALCAAMRDSGLVTCGPLGRGAVASDAAVVLLCVPDREIDAAAALIAPGALVGHVSASADIGLLKPHERFVMHPLLSVIGAGAQFAGATAAIDGSTPRGLAVASALAERLGMRPVVVPASQRALYHAAASAASNFLITLEKMAEDLATRAGLDRGALVPLVRATVDNWARLGAQRALTGPIARGDVATAERQREAVASAAAEHLPLWDALASATSAMAAEGREQCA